MAPSTRVAYTLTCQYQHCPRPGKQFTAHRCDAKFCGNECRSAARPSRIERKEARELLVKCSYIYPHGERCNKPQVEAHKFFSHYGLYRRTDSSALRQFKPVLVIHQGGIAYWPLPQADSGFGLMRLPVPLLLDPKMAGFCHAHAAAERSKPKQARHKDGTRELEFEAYLPHPNIFEGAVHDHALHESYEQLADRIAAIDAYDPNSWNQTIEQTIEEDTLRTAAWIESSTGMRVVGYPERGLNGPDDAHLNPVLLITCLWWLLCAPEREILNQPNGLEIIRARSICTGASLSLAS